MLPPLQLLDLGFELDLLLLGLADDLLAPHLGVLDDQRRFLAGVLLHVLGQLLRHDHGVLDRLFPLLQLAHALVVDLPELAQLRHLAQERFHLFPDQVEERVHFGTFISRGRPCETVSAVCRAVKYS